MVAIDDTADELDEKGICFINQWPREFTLMARNECQDVLLDNNNYYNVFVSFYGSGISAQHKRDLASLLIPYDSDKFLEWVGAMTSRFCDENDDIELEWLENSDVIRDIRRECGLKVVAILNLMDDGPTLTPHDELIPVSLIMQPE